MKAFLPSSQTFPRLQARHRANFTGALWYEIGRPNQAQDDPHGKWEPSPSGIMQDGRCEKLIPYGASLKLASASR
jgi:hypothetical protein